MISPIDRLFDAVHWMPVDHDEDGTDADLPYATHDGWVVIGDLSLHVYQLNTGVRVIDEESLQRFFRWLGGDEEGSTRP